MAGKKRGTSLVGLYFVEDMTDSELKEYIEALTEETERMKQSFKQHQENQTELSELLRNTQEIVHDLSKMAMQKDMELQQLLFESHCELKAEGRRLMLAELEDPAAKDSTANFMEISCREMDRLDTEKGWKKNLESCDKRIEYSGIIHGFVSMDILEKNVEQLSSLVEANGNLKRSYDEYSEKYRELVRDFYKEKKDKMMTTWEPDMEETLVANSESDTAEAMSQYFNDIFWKNIKAKAQLEERMGKLKKELAKINGKLRYMKKGNGKVQEAETQDEGGEDDTSVSDVKSTGTEVKDNAINELIFENDVLTEKLRQVTVEKEYLENSFISAMRKIYRKADFSSFIYEQMLRAVEGNKQNEDAAELTDHKEDSKSATNIENKNNDDSSSRDYQ